MFPPTHTTNTNTETNKCVRVLYYNNKKKIDDLILYFSKICGCLCQEKFYFIIL
jgi:hypothetical protein